MKKYEYVSIQLEGHFIASTNEHGRIIDEYAAKGYNYVGYIPTKMTSHGRITEIDLIFEAFNT